MDLNATVDVNCEREDGRTACWTENRTPISPLAKAGATKNDTDERKQKVRLGTAKNELTKGLSAGSDASTSPWIIRYLVLG